MPKPETARFISFLMSIMSWARLPDSMAAKLSLPSTPRTFDDKTGESWLSAFSLSPSVW